MKNARSKLLCDGPNLHRRQRLRLLLRAGPSLTDMRMRGPPSTPTLHNPSADLYTGCRP
jgi:hypothetical protein